MARVSLSGTNDRSCALRDRLGAGLVGDPSSLTVGITLDLQAPDSHDSPAVLRADGRLFIETQDGRQHLAEGAALGVVFGDRQHATRHGLEPAIDRMLGRGEPRPPDLGWFQLRPVLDQVGVALTDDELIAMPLVLELSSELLAELDP
jgi:hypothetical protein